MAEYKEYQKVNKREQPKGDLNPYWFSELINYSRR